MVVFLRSIAAASAFLGAGMSLWQYFVPDRAYWPRSTIRRQPDIEKRRTRAGLFGLLMLVAGAGWTASAITYQGEQESKVSEAEQRYQQCLDEVRQDQAESGFGDESFLTPEDLCESDRPTPDDD